MISFVDQDLTLKPRTDLYLFIFGGREFHTDRPREHKTHLI